MRSYYGNLVVDIFELIFSIISLLLVWVSSSIDTIYFFGISTIVYLLPRFLTLVLGISNNGRDILRLVFDIISLVTLFLSFAIVCVLLFNEVKPDSAGVNNKDNLFIAFYVISGISLFDIIYKCIIGLAQKVSLIVENLKYKLN